MLEQSELDRILDNATVEQSRYILAWMEQPGNRSQACRAAKISRRAMYSWANLEELEEAARLLAIDAVKLRVAVLAFGQNELIDATPEAIAALRASLKDKVRRVAAAKEILDRVGLVARSALDVTMQGPPVTLVEVIVPFDGKDDDDEAT